MTHQLLHYHSRHQSEYALLHKLWKLSGMHNEVRMQAGRNVRLYYDDYLIHILIIIIHIVDYVNSLNYS